MASLLLSSNAAAIKLLDSADTLNVLFLKVLVNSLPTNDAYMRHEIFVRERPMTHIRVMANAYTYSDAVAARRPSGFPYLSDYIPKGPHFLLMNKIICIAYANFGARAQ